MAKRIKNPIEFKATVRFGELNSNGYTNGEGEPLPFEIEDVSVHYGRTCEYGDLGRKGLPLELTQEVLNMVKDCVEEGIRQAELHEEILEEDSIL